jgi:ABC-type antimicrobial peptide transport system permease subunit
MSRSQRIAREVVASLMSNKQRALLMMLGVAAGVAVLSAVIAIGQGTRERVMELVQVHNLDMIMVRAGGEVQIFAPQADRGLASLTNEDARVIETEIADIGKVSVVQNQRGINLVYQDRSANTRVFGVDPGFSEIRYRPVTQGEFLTDADVASMARVAVLGDKVAKALFPDGDAVGKVIRVENDPYTVKGVFAEIGQSADGVEDQDDRLVIPYTTSARRLLNRPYVEQIVINVPNIENIPQVAERIRALLRDRHSISVGENDDFFVREPDAVVDAALATPATLFALMAGISVVALIAGGIVIMNLMLMGIAQRAREIGLRRAIGARASDISRQFLLESLFIALAGGVLGAIVGLAVASGLEAAGLVASRITALPFAIAFLACLAVGLVFGVQPARKAARIDPASTLRGRAA